MKAVYKHTKMQRHFGIVRRNGRIALPPDFSEFRLGQRVYFHLRKEGVVVGATPKRTVNGRLLSSRIRRGISSHQALERIAQREKAREARQRAELSARVDQRLAALNAPQAHLALDSFMDEPIVLGGKLRAGAVY